MALIGFAGAPFTVASYAVEGGPSRTFAKVKALMHGNPDLWQQLTDRLAAMAVASLRAQIEAGAQAVQLFDSWAGSLAPDEYARFALPATRAVLAGIADLGVPTILFGVGTGELLGLMGSGRLRRRRRRLAGPARRGPPACRCRARGAGQSRPRALPGAVARRGGGHAGRCWPLADDGTGTGHVFNLGHGVLPESDPGILAAVVELVHAETAPGMTTGVLLMAHGTPASTTEIAPFYTRIRRGRPPDARAAGRARRALRRHRWRLAPDRSAPRHRSTPCARARRAARRAATWCRSAPSTPTPLIEEAAADLGAAGRRTGHRPRPHPHGSSYGLTGVPRPRRRRARATTPFVPVAPWYAHPGSSRCSPPACEDARRAADGPHHA